MARPRSAGTRAREVVAELRAMSDPTQLEGMARFGIRTDRALGGIGLINIRTIAGLAWHDRHADDALFTAFLPLVEREAWDERKYVWKGVNWALRQIGKRNHALNVEAVACAERVLAQDTKSARWIAKDALKELRSEETAAMLDRAAARAAPRSTPASGRRVRRRRAPP